MRLRDAVKTPPHSSEETVGPSGRSCGRVGCSGKREGWVIGGPIADAVRGGRTSRTRSHASVELMAGGNKRWPRHERQQATPPALAATGSKRGRVGFGRGVEQVRRRHRRGVLPFQKRGFSDKSVETLSCQDASDEGPIGARRRQQGFLSKLCAL